MLTKNRAGGPVHLLPVRRCGCTPYSYGDPQFNQAIGAGFTEKELIETQIRQTDQALKERFPGVALWHLLDRNGAARRHDDETTFELLEGLESYFVIRLKANRRATPRNSNETQQDKKGKTLSVKLKKAKFFRLISDHRHCFIDFFL